MKLSRLQIAWACLLMGVTLVTQATDPLAKPKQAAGKAQTSGRYRLVDDKGYTVCKKFLKNLNAFPETEPPMVCEQKIHPMHPEFTKPKWEEMEVQSNLNIVYAAEVLLPNLTRIGTQPLPFDEWKKTFQERIKTGAANPRLRRVVLAINGHDPETIISYESDILECQKAYQEFKVSQEPGDVGGHNFILFSGAAAERELENSGGVVEARVPESNAILQTINYGSWWRKILLIWRSLPYLVDARADSTKVDYKKPKSPTNQPEPVWSIDIQQLYRSPNLGAPQYGADNRCEFHIDRYEPEIVIPQLFKE